MYSVELKSIGAFKAIRLINKTNGEYVEIIQDLGAALNDLVVLGADGKMHSLVQGNRSEAEIREEHHRSFKGNKLLPYPNRIKGGEYVFQGTNYQFPIHFKGEQNSIHGFVHNRSFDLKEQSEGGDGAYVLLSYNYSGLEQGYPFPFEAQIKYAFDNSGLTVSTTIKNTHSEVIPIADGWHPYFTLGNDAGDWELKMPKVQQLVVDEQMIPTGEKFDYDDFTEYKLIQNTLFDTCFELKQRSAKETVSIRNNELALDIWSDSREGKYSHLQVFIPSHRRSIAVEPMNCAPNVFNDDIQSCYLLPGNKLELDFGLRWSLR